MAKWIRNEYYKKLTYENLFKQAYIDITKNNIFKLPLGSSNITIQADDEIVSAKLNIYPYYRSI